MIVYLEEEQEHYYPDEPIEKPKVPPAVPPRPFKLPPIQSLKSSQIRRDDIFYDQTFDQLQKILQNIDRTGVYAVSYKTKPEPDSSLALRVYENINAPVSSWNIYEDKKKNQYYLTESDPMFDNIVELCLYYTKNNLPTELKTKNYRLTSPYKHYL